MKKIDNQRTSYTLRYEDPQTGLVVRCAAVAYHDFPTVEWTVYFSNRGTTNSLILSDIKALDTHFDR